MEYIFDKLEQRLNKYVKDNYVSGLSIVVMKDDRIIFDKIFGDVSNNTLYRLASLTKPITAAAVLICQDKGLLNVDDYIDKYIPSLTNFHVKGEKDTYRITIKQLLCHASGFPTTAFEDHRFDKGDISLENAMKTYEKFILQSIPETKETYSNEAYDVAARIVEVVSGLKYEEFLKKYIFNILDMKETTYHLNNSNIKNVPILTTYKDGKLIPDNNIVYGFDNYPNGFNGGGAGLLSTIHDYIKFANMLTNKGKGILSQESFNELIKKYDTPYYDSPFGLSVHVRRGLDWEHLPKGSFGWSGAYGPHYFSIPKEKITVVYMHNSHSFGGAGALHNYDLEDDICEIFNLNKKLI